MKRKKTATSDPGEATRLAFSEAAGLVEPDVSRLVGRVPEILAEARRRRVSRTRPASLADILLPVARRALPRLAAATAVLLVVAFVIGDDPADPALETRAGLDRYILTGDLGDGVEDLLLEAINYEANDDG